MPHFICLLACLLPLCNIALDYSLVASTWRVIAFVCSHSFVFPLHSCPTLLTTVFFPLALHCVRFLASFCTFFVLGALVLICNCSLASLCSSFLLHFIPALFVSLQFSLQLANEYSPLRTHTGSFYIYCLHAELNDHCALRLRQHITPKYHCSSLQKRQKLPGKGIKPQSDKI